MREGDKKRDRRGESGGKGGEGRKRVEEGGGSRGREEKG